MGFLIDRDQVTFRRYVSPEFKRFIISCLPSTDYSRSRKFIGDIAYIIKLKLNVKDSEERQGAHFDTKVEGKNRIIVRRLFLLGLINIRYASIQVDIVEKK